MQLRPPQVDTRLARSSERLPRFAARFTPLMEVGLQLEI